MRSRRPDQYRPGRDPAENSSYFAFHKRHFEDFFVHDRTVTEETRFAEQLAVIGGDRDIGILGNDVEQFFHHTVQVLDRLDLAVAQHAAFRAAEEETAAFDQLSAHHLVVEM